MERERPKRGEIYRHFLGKRYEVLCSARHTETEAELVIDQARYGERGMYARPLTMFLSPVDKEKYPDAAQVWRFELLKQEEDGDVSPKEGTSLIFDFLELTEDEARLQFLLRNKTRIDEAFVSAACESLEYVPGEGTLEEVYQELMKLLKTRMRYEGRRLR